MSHPSFAGILPDEQVRYEASFTPHLILKHIKTTLVVTDRRVLVHHPHVIFGFFEHGYAKREIPLRHVSLVAAGTRTSTSEVIKAVVAALVGIAAITSGYGGAIGAIAILVGLVLLAAAVLWFLGANGNAVSIQSTGGESIVARGSKQQFAQIQQAGDEIGRLLST